MSQTQWVLDRLLSGYSITPLDALKGCGCMRLAARINDLRQGGFKIKTEKISKGNKTFASYKLNEPWGRKK